jgi:trehalose-phosphatase
MQPPSRATHHLVDEDLRERLVRAQLGLLLDFDGTLSEIVATPDQARLLPSCREAVEHLLALGVLVGIVSGRTADDLATRAPFADVWLSGVHGAELTVPGPARMSTTSTPELRVALEAFLSAARELEPWGVRVEDKRLAVAAHVRGVEPTRQREAITRLIGFAQAVAVDTGVVSWIEGKAVIELRSRHASKANAVRMLHRSWPAGTFLIAVGDDATDEDMFLETLRVGGTAIKVGDDGPTAAPHRVSDPSDVASFLSALAAALELSAADRSARDDGGPRRGR